MMRILGIDPGCTVTGWGIVESKGTTLRHVANGCIRTQAQAPFPQRLGTIFADLTRIVAEHHPQAVAVEKVFVSVNVQSALKLGHARGVAIVAASSQGVPVYEYTALQVKKSVVGYGRAEKQQMQEMIRILLGMGKKVPQDAADALGVAVCHINHQPLRLLQKSALVQESRVSHPVRLSSSVSVSPPPHAVPADGLLRSEKPA